MAGEKGFGISPISEESSSSLGRKELVGPQIMLSGGMLKRRRDSEADEEQPSTDRSQATEISAGHESTDSIIPAMQVFLASSDNPSYTSVEVSARSNSRESKETLRVCKKRRIQYDSPEDVTTIQYVGPCGAHGYLKLNDCDGADPYTLKMSNYLPDPNDPTGSHNKYRFKWTFKKPQAAQLTVLTYYVALDVSTSPPKLKAVAQPPADDAVALVHRRGINGNWMLFFNYSNKCYQIIVENGAVALEKRESQDKLDCLYIFETSPES